MPAPDRADARPAQAQRGPTTPVAAPAKTTPPVATPARTTPTPASAKAPPSHAHDGAGHGSSADSTFRHSYSKDKAQLVRRLSRIEGQVRGIARMIERDEYCVDILQQTSALRAAVDALAIMVLEDHVQGCVRTAAARGEADEYVTEVLEVVRRTLGRPIRGARSS
jgi:DNA-binding FrmR family transcriptional regulator